MSRLLGVISWLVISNLALAESSGVQLPMTSTSDATAGESKTPLRDVLGNQKFQENNEITDAKIKADAGSLSKYSLKFNLSYYGPTMGDLSAKDQPNPDGSIGTYETSIGGSLGGRYRIDPKTTVSVGSGVKLVHPFHGMDRTDLNNPYISYDKTAKIAGIQMRNSIGASYITIPNYTAVGEYASVNYDASFFYDLGKSGYSVGLDSSLGYFLYGRDYKKSDRSAGRANWAFYPTVKYNFSDYLNINTSTNISFWNPRARKDEFALLNRTVSQRLGLGYLYSRDVYISPYVNFFPDKLSWDRTTLNIVTSFSLM